MLNAVVEGYQDHMFDMMCLSVYNGFWAGYYMNSKRAAKPGDVLQKMEKRRLAQKSKTVGTIVSKPKAEVDVEAFLEQERSFNERRETLGRG